MDDSDLLRPSLAVSPEEAPPAALCVFAGLFGGMFPSSTSTTPFSVKDILNLEHQNSFENEFMTASQDAPVRYQQGDRGHYDMQQEPPFASGMPEKLDAHTSVEEEAINEHGEI